jgi:hypothetical protein
MMALARAVVQLFDHQAASADAVIADLAASPSGTIRRWDLDDDASRLETHEVVARTERLTPAPWMRHRDDAWAPAWVRLVECVASAENDVIAAPPLPT